MSGIISLFGRENELAVLELLAESQKQRGAVDARDLAPAMAAEYATNELYGLWGYDEDGLIVGLAGIEWSEEGRIRLIDIAVIAARQRQGIGRQLMQHLQLTLDPRAIAGVTLAAAIPFFEATGYRVDPFGEMPSGEPRYRFLWLKP